MATLNPFDLLGDDAEDPSQLAVSIPADKSKKSGPVSGLHAKSTAPSKQLPPSQAVREARSDAPRGGGRGGGDRGGFSRGRGGYNRDFRGGDGPGGNNGYSGGYSKPSEEGDVSKSSYERRSGGYGGPRGGRRGGFSNEAGEGERPRRTFERRSGTGRGGDFKREGAGRGNWGTPGEEVLVVDTEEVAGVETEKDAVEKPADDDVAADANKENTAEVEEQKEPEDKEMTLDEYEKILEEKKKALQSQNTSERKVDTKVFESMQQLSNKKANDEIFIKLGSDKDKRKDDKEEKAKKAVSINEFLKPAEGENYYRGGRGGRGRGGRDRGGVSSGGFGGNRSEAAPAIGDTAQFPSLGGK